MKMTKTIVIAVAAIMMTAQMAHAKRFGGGFRSSPSVSRSYSVPKAPTQAPVNMTKAPAPVAAKVATPATPAVAAPSTGTRTVTRAAPSNTGTNMLMGMAVGAALMSGANAATTNTSHDVPLKQDPCADKEKAKNLQECQKPKQ